MKKSLVAFAILCCCASGCNRAQDTQHTPPVTAVEQQNPSAADTSVTDNEQCQPVTVSHPELPMDTTFTTEEVMLLKAAEDAADHQDYTKADLLYHSILMIKDSNYVWYIRGNLYARQNRCIEARNAFEQVPLASPVLSESFPPEFQSFGLPVFKDTSELNVAAQNRLNELETRCSAKVIFACSPAGTKLSIDGGIKFCCSNNPVSLTPGQHRVIGQTSFGYTSMDIEAIDGKTTQVKLEIK